MQPTSLNLYLPSGAKFLQAGSIVLHAKEKTLGQDLWAGAADRGWSIFAVVVGLLSDFGGISNLANSWLLIAEPGRAYSRSKHSPSIQGQFNPSLQGRRGSHVTARGNPAVINMLTEDAAGICALPLSWSSVPRHLFDTLLFSLKP